MANAFLVPKLTIYGENAMKTAMAELKAFGKKAMIVTDKSMVDLGNIKKLTDELDKTGISYSVYSEINSEPNHTMVDNGVVFLRKEKCDFLTGLGGGSPIDAMKAIAAASANGGSITGYLGKQLDKDLPPMAAIPTTAGTGSEATKFSIITNTETNVKMLLSNPKLMVNLAILETDLTL